MWKGSNDLHYHDWVNCPVCKYKDTPLGAKGVLELWIDPPDQSVGIMGWDIVNIEPVQHCDCGHTAEIVAEFDLDNWEDCPVIIELYGSIHYNGDC